MTPAFDIADVSTWPTVMNIDELAAIYRRAPGGVKKACQQGRFVPAPFQNRPWLFRKADVVRHVEGARGSLRRVS